MSDVDMPSLKDRLWHSMRADLSKFAPEIADTQVLMCCLCGRWLGYGDFDIEHLVPRQALRADPIEVRNNPNTSANVRSRNLLLCKKRLMYRNSAMYENGCNSWKGRFYDGPIADIFSGKAAPSAHGRIRTTHIVGSLILGYLAMVAEFGYIVALMKSGLLLREQFFRPHKFHPQLPTRHQMILVGKPAKDPDNHVWTKPFSFAFERGACIVTARNFVMMIPISRDPREPVAQKIKFVPSRFAFRPDFSTGFH